MKKLKLNDKSFKGCNKDFICSYCNDWVFGIGCNLKRSYKDCEKLVIKQYLRNNK